MMNETVKKTLIAVPKNAESPYVFCHVNGKPYTDVKNSFHTALKKCGIINFKFHDLRHAFASRLVMSGADLKTVQELLGHKSIEMTMRYAHLSPSHKKWAVNLLYRQNDTLMTPEPNTDKTIESNEFYNALQSK